MAERSVEQAKQAFTNYNQAAQEAVSTFDQWIEASQVGEQGISKKAMKVGQCNVLSAFDFHPGRAGGTPLDVSGFGLREPLPGGGARFVVRIRIVFSGFSQSRFSGIIPTLRSSRLLLNVFICVSMAQTAPFSCVIFS